LQSEKILTVAARLFATQRFHEARMEDIAAAAEVGKGTLYRYFKDKEELYLALLERGAVQLQERLRQVVEGEGGPRARLEAMVAAILEYFDAHPHLFDLIQHAEVMHRADATFPWQQTRAQNLKIVKDIFEEGRRCGEFAVADAELGALMLLGGLRAVLRFGPRPRDPDQAARITEGFLYGYAQPVEAGEMTWPGRHRA
jgi:TetR/AcrR family fatty acid metabolism transcriptional regulator